MLLIDNGWLGHVKGSLAGTGFYGREQNSLLLPNDGQYLLNVRI